MERKTRIIIFDDDPNIRQSLESVFQHRGYEVLAYDDPSLCPLQHEHDCQCEENERCADFVITDIDMPSVSGLDFIDGQVRKGCKVQNIAIMSGSWSEADTERAKYLGCAVFKKPVPFSAFTEWFYQCESQVGQGGILSDWFLQKESDDARS